MNPAIGKGVYSVREAARLTGVTPGRIRRWFSGYDFETKQGHRRMPPVVPDDDRVVDGVLQLSFLDLVEIRVIDGFLGLGVPWRELRRSASVGAEMWATRHPFASLRFKTNGRRIFAKVHDQTGSETLLELSSRQHVFAQIVEMGLRGVEFDGNSAVRWWPLGERRHIVIDPRRSFGKPIASISGVPAAILASHAERNGVEATCNWYEVRAAEVRDAERFVKKFAA